MKVFQIIGHPGSGKTTLVADLVREFCRQNVSVGTIKHSAHDHELDKPGKDSHVHRAAGAAPAAMMTLNLAAIYIPRSPGMSPATIIERYYSHVDVVLIEGWISGPFKKIEVWRKGVGRPFLFPGIANVKALVSDDKLDALMVQHAEEKQVIRLARSALGDIAALINGQ